MAKQKSGGMFESARRWVAESILGVGLSSGPIDADDDLYRRLTDRAKMRDLSPMDQAQMLKICRFLYDGQPLAGWLIDGRVDLLLGDELGFSVEVDAKALELDDEAAAELTRKIRRALDRFWDHPAHNFRMRADEYVTSHMLDGDLCLVVAGRNDVDGLPVFDFIDAGLVARVEPVSGSSLVPGRVVLKAEPGKQEKSLEVIRWDAKQRILSGECGWWRNSRLPNAMRGRSEIFRQADWIDTFDQFLFARADRAVLMNSLLWDVELTGAGASEVKSRANEIRKEGPNKPGTTRVHNDREKWSAIVPELNAGDATDEAKLVRNHILGSKSLPAAWYAEGGDVNRATAGEQSDVALMALRFWRKRIRMIFGDVLAFAYDCLHEKAPSIYPNRLDGVRLKVDLPPLAERDVSRLGGVVQNIEAALELAVGRELISSRTARKVFLHIVDRLGVPVDPDAEEAQITVESENRKTADATASNAAALAALEKGLEPAPASAGGAA